jgi:hypothetical protein
VISLLLSAYRCFSASLDVADWTSGWYISICFRNAADTSAFEVPLLMPSTEYLCKEVKASVSRRQCEEERRNRPSAWLRTGHSGQIPTDISVSISVGTSRAVSDLFAAAVLVVAAVPTAGGPIFPNRNTSQSHRDHV